MGAIFLRGPVFERDSGTANGNNEKVSMVVSVTHPFGIAAVSATHGGFSHCGIEKFDDFSGPGRICSLGQHVEAPC